MSEFRPDVVYTVRELTAGIACLLHKVTGMDIITASVPDEWGMTQGVTPYDG